MKNIPGYETFRRIEPLHKGMSNDQKYCIETNDNRRLLLRIGDIAELNRKENEYMMMQRVAELGLPMSRPLHFGICEDKAHIFILCTWCDGIDMEELMPTLSEADRYTYGLKSGRLLHRMHQLSATNITEPWEDRFNRKVSQNMACFAGATLDYVGLDTVLSYIEKNRSVIKNRPQCFAHGDFNTGNMILTPEKELVTCQS